MLKINLSKFKKLDNNHFDYTYIYKKEEQPFN